jgi:hemoglobin
MAETAFGSGQACGRAVMIWIKAALPLSRHHRFMTAAPEPRAPTPFEAIGGVPSIAAVVDRFYDLMQTDPAYAQLRDLHGPDLTPMRASLTGFLTGWLGGPRDWFAARPGACMMSIHAPVPVTPQTASQWTHAMARALAEAGVESELCALIDEAFARMARGMAARG